MEPIDKDYSKNLSKYQKSNKQSPFTELQCPCERYLCGNQTYRFIQPPIRKSFAHPEKFCTPKAPLDTNTLYQESFIPFGNCKRESFKPTQNLIESGGKFQNDTTSKATFTSWKNAQPATPVKPFKNCLMHKGILSWTTTNQSDFDRKPYSKREGFKTSGKVHSEGKPMETKSTNMVAYGNPPPFTKPQRFKQDMQKSSFPQGSNPQTGASTNTTSYLPWPVLRKTDTTKWSGKSKYAPPTTKFQNCSTYCTYFKPSPTEKTSSCKPLKDTPELITPYDYVTGTSVYRDIFCPQLRIPNEIQTWTKASINFGNNPMTTKSMYSDSFPQHENYSPNIVKIKTNKYVQKGALQTSTTQKSDFSLKPYSKRSLSEQPQGYKPDLGRSFYETTNQSYFKPPDRFNLTRVAKPAPAFKIFSDCPTAESTYKQNFVRWILPRKVDISNWKYQTAEKSNLHFNGTSSYQDNFRPPGILVKDNKPCCVAGCKCSFPLECRQDITTQRITAQNNVEIKC